MAVLVVALHGVSCSGKTWLANKLKQQQQQQHRAAPTIHVVHQVCVPRQSIVTSAPSLENISQPLSITCSSPCSCLDQDDFYQQDFGKVPTVSVNGTKCHNWDCVEALNQQLLVSTIKQHV